MKVVVSLEGLSKQELRNLIIVARGEWVSQELIRIGDTKIVAQGYENDPQPLWYTLFFEGEEIYSSAGLNALFETDKYGNKAINEDEIDDLRNNFWRILMQW